MPFSAPQKDLEGFRAPEKDISPSEKPSLKKAVSKTAHVVLPVTGGIVGGAVTAPFSPVAQFGGGALGYAGGVAGANLLDRLMGLNAPLEAKNIPAEVVSNVKEGAIAELAPRAVVSGAKSAIKGVAKVAESSLPPVMQAMTGVVKQRFKDIMKYPKNVLPEFLGGPKSLEKAGSDYAKAAESSFGKSAKLTAAEINDPALSVARENAVTAANFVDSIKDMPEAARIKIFNNPEVGALLVKGRKGTQAQLNSPAIKGEQRALLAEQADTFNGLLEKYFPQFREASTEYARSITRSDVMKVLPVLKSGDPSISRMVLSSLAGVAGTAAHGTSGGLATLAAMSPVVNALTAAGVSGSLKAAARVAALPGMKQVIQTGMAASKSPEYKPLAQSSTNVMEIMKSIQSNLERRKNAKK